MPTTIEQLTAEALALPGEQRARLVDQLLASLDAAGINHIDRLVSAGRGTREKFDRVLAKVPAVEPDAHDRLSPHDTA